MIRAELATQIKALLLEEKSRLEHELSQIAHPNPAAASTDYTTDFPQIGERDETENAAEVATYSDNLSLEGELERALRDVETALELLEKGGYGVCKYCHQPIDERRLLARPTSTSCIQCKKTLTQEL